jgi:hypothetical protein
MRTTCSDVKETKENKKANFYTESVYFGIAFFYIFIAFTSNFTAPYFKDKCIKDSGSYIAYEILPLVKSGSCTYSKK